MDSYFKAIISGLFVVCLFSGCETPKPEKAHANSPAHQARRQAILAEEPGDYYIGRRYHIERTRYWGYLRRPRNGWETAKLVLMNESLQPVPDSLLGQPDGERMPVQPDHNFEYRIYGHYSGRNAYDPSSNMVLSEFILEDYELIDSAPGWLFDPQEIHHSRQLQPGTEDGERETAP
jgi:hypothetical protein